MTVPVLRVPMSINLDPAARSADAIPVLSRFALHGVTLPRYFEIARKISATIADAVNGPVLEPQRRPLSPPVTSGELCFARRK
jgi:hypothetical protein